MATGNNNLHLLTIDVVEDTISNESKPSSQKIAHDDDQTNFWEMKSAFGWKHAISTELRDYFPHYHIQQSKGIIRLSDFRLYNCL